MKTKRKTKLGIRGATPFEFYSDFQFEECLYHLEHDTTHLKMDVEQRLDDQARFIMTLKGNDEKNGNISGTLQRWGDAATRVEGMIFSHPAVSIRRQVVLSIISLLPFAILIVLFALDPSPLSYYRTKLCLGLPLALLVTIGIIWGSITLIGYRFKHKLIYHLEDFLTDKRKKGKAEGNFDENYDNRWREAGIHSDSAGQQSNPQTPH